MFDNPLFGLAAGMLLTAIIQSSSASVGILQALSMTGAISWGMAVPIILGQNIGTCVTALLSGIGTNKNAKRAAMIHLYFNIIGALFMLIVYLIARAVPALKAQHERHAALVQLAVEFGQALLQLRQFRAVLVFID